MKLKEDIHNLLLGKPLPWDHAYNDMSLGELISLKGEYQVARDATGDQMEKLAYTTRIAIVNPFIDAAVALEDARRVIESLSPAAKEAAVLVVQGMHQKVRVRNG